MRKDKEKVLDAVWTEEHIRSFLDARPHDGTDPDFFVLLRAYQSMRAEDFAGFIGFFREQGRAINARGRDGRTLLDIVGEHRRGGDYTAILKAAGAT